MSSRPKLIANPTRGAARFAPLLDAGAPQAYDRNLVGQKSRKHGLFRRKPKVVATDYSDSGTVVVKRDDPPKTVVGKMLGAVGAIFGRQLRLKRPPTGPALGG